MTLAPGASERIEGVRSQSVEFQVPEGVDKPTAEIVATPTLPADLDLYLQHLGSDGERSVDFAAGTSGELTPEEMTTGRLPAGTCRIVVHNRTGPAGNLVPVNVTFFNTTGWPAARQVEPCAPGVRRGGPGAGIARRALRGGSAVQGDRQWDERERVQAVVRQHGRMLLRSRAGSPHARKSRGCLQQALEMFLPRAAAVVRPPRLRC